MAPRKDEAPQDISALKRQRLSARRLNDKLSKAVEAALAQQVRQLTNELSKERAQCEALTGQLNEANDKLNIATKSREGLRVQLDAERKTNAQAQIRLADANARLAEANAKLKTATDQCGSLRAELTKQRDDSVKLTSERDAERKKSADLENQLKQLRDKALPHAVFKACSCLFAPTHNYDFRNASDAGMTFSRGGVRYNRPMGSMRYALEVANRYDDKDWLQDGVGGWAVAYHGTTRENAVSIIRNGFHLSKGTRFGYGTGVYCTPDPNTAKTRYAKNFIENGKTCLVVIQVRVKPGRYTVAWPGDGVQGAYWLVPDTADIRPYGLCVYGI